MTDLDQRAAEQLAFKCRRCGSADLRIFVMDLVDAITAVRGAVASYKCRACGRVWFIDLRLRAGAGEEGQRP